MGIFCFSLQFDQQGLPEVERVTGEAPGLADNVMTRPGVDGVVVLRTCNRFEVLVDARSDAAELREMIDGVLEHRPDWGVYVDEEAIRHLFRVAAGLRSMVVGEREIVGQLRRAVAEARDAGRLSPTLDTVVDRALATSRKVAHGTGLPAAGRSIVSEGLQLVGIDGWQDASVLVVGTGSYAGAVLAALRTREVREVTVYSASGRARGFAESHAVRATEDLDRAMDEADLVVTCRGLGTIITADRVRPGMRFLDLSLVRDVDRSVDAQPGVVVIDLARIQRSVRELFADDTGRAEAIVEEGLAKVLARLRSRAVGPAITQLRESLLDLVAEELERLPSRQLTRDDTAKSLRRLATRMLHVPSMRARRAAELGRTDQYLLALNELYGIDAVADAPVGTNGGTKASPRSADD